MRRLTKRQMILRRRSGAATIPFDADVLAALKATGKGWQTRVNDAMRDWVKAHPQG